MYKLVIPSGNDTSAYSCPIYMPLKVYLRHYFTQRMRLGIVIWGGWLIPNSPCCICTDVNGIAWWGMLSQKVTWPMILSTIKVKSVVKLFSQRFHRRRLSVGALFMAFTIISL